MCGQLKHLDHWFWIELGGCVVCMIVDNSELMRWLLYGHYHSQSHLWID